MPFYRFHLKAAALALRLEDEADIALSKAPRDDVFALPNQDNLRFIADRLQGLIGEGE